MDFIKECLAQLKMRLRLDTAIVEKLEDLEKRVYALEQDIKLLKARNQIQDKALTELRLVVQNERKVVPAPKAAEPAAPAKVGY